MTQFQFFVNSTVCPRVFLLLTAGSKSLVKIVVAAMIWEISGFESDKFSTCVSFDIFKMDLFIYILEFRRKIAYENH